MRFPRHKFSELKYHLMGQTFLCTLFMGFVLLIMGIFSGDSVAWAVGSTSLASSACSVFVTPFSAISRPKKILLAYGIASVVGLIFHAVLGYFSLKVSGNFYSVDSHFFWVLSALAVAATMILMMFLGAQHPPAAGIALSMASNISNFRIFFAIWVSVLVLIAIRLIFSKHLRDLIE